MITADDVLPQFLEWFLQALRNFNSAIYVAQEVPDWQQKYQDAQNNPLLNDQIDRLAALSREIVEHALGHRETTEDFHSRLEQLKQALREQIH